MNFVTPQGFRDVLCDEALLREVASEKFAKLTAESGYLPIETPTLEVMNVLDASNQNPTSPFKFYDLSGNLLAMRPDVTLQIARMAATRLANEPGPFRFRYKQRVFREATGAASAQSRENTQLGIELIGQGNAEADSEVVGLFARSLAQLGVKNFTISLASVGVLRMLLEKSGGDATWHNAVLQAYHACDFAALDALCKTCEKHNVSAEFAAAIDRLAHIRGGSAAIAEVKSLVEPLGCDAGLNDLNATYSLLEKAGLTKHIQLDFSVVSSFDYYTGIVFEAYSPNVASPLGSGGRYDNTLAAFGCSKPAAGFAFCLETVLDAASKPHVNESTYAPLRIAVPKGSLNSGAIACLRACGLDVSGLENPGRHLIIKAEGVEYIIVRPTDAPMFVKLGAADCGICGKDSLLEARTDVAELADLSFGACRFVVAQPKGANESVQEHLKRTGSLRVATKYPNITRNYFEQHNIQVEVVKFNGNIELAPLCGVAEQIVDITATGTTLRENNLEVVDNVLSSTARFFANKCSMRTNAKVRSLAHKMREGQKSGKWKTTVIAGVS